MLFYVMLILLVVSPFATYYFAFMTWDREGTAILSFITFFFCVIFTLVIFLGYSKALVGLKYIEKKIDNYQIKLESLNSRIEAYKQSGGKIDSVIYANHDSPIGTAIISIQKAEEDLTKARNKKEDYCSAIEWTHIGPFSGIKSFFDHSIYLEKC